MMMMIRLPQLIRFVVSFLLLTTMMMMMMNGVVVNAADGSKQEVLVETQKEGTGPKVTSDHMYMSHVTLYIDDEKRTPSGWSTRVEHGADIDRPFNFQPGRGLIEGWTIGVLQMNEGERALLHVPAHLGYGSRPMGSPNEGSAFWIPANSDLLFDIEILGKVGSESGEL